MQFGGSYRPQNGGESGFFFVTVIDCSPATSTSCVDLTLNDFIQIELSDGEYAGYANAGELQGGVSVVVEPGFKRLPMGFSPGQK